MLLALPLGMMIAALMWIRDLTTAAPGPRFLQAAPTGRGRTHTPDHTDGCDPARTAGGWAADGGSAVTAIEVVVLGTMAVAAGLVLAVAALRPAAPSLHATLAQVRAAPVLGSADPSGVWAGGSGGRRGVWTRWLERLSGRVADTDLAITGRTRAQVSASRLGWCLVALFTPTVAGAVLAVTGWPVPIAVPAVTGLVLAVIAWFVQEASLHDDAEKLRAQFQAALTSYLALVALERQVRGSPVEALEEAARLGQGWPFQLISAELVRAEARGVPPWTGLRELGERLGIERLRSLADIVAAAEDGAAVFGSLLAEARTLRAAELADSQARANVVSEQLGQPLALLALATLVLGMLPAMLRLLNS